MTQKWLWKKFESWDKKIDIWMHFMNATAAVFSMDFNYFNNSSFQNKLPDSMQEASLTVRKNIEVLKSGILD